MAKRIGIAEATTTKVTGRFTSGMKHSGLMILLALLCFNVIVFSPDLIGVTTLPALSPSAGTFSP